MAVAVTALFKNKLLLMTALLYKNTAVFTTAGMS
jgi:hypothetical protein